jgi:hypothetical protein
VVNEEIKKYSGSDEESQKSKELTASSFDMSEEDFSKMKKWSLALRVLYMCVSILMAAAAALALNGASLGTVFIALYVFFFAIIICCFELALSMVSIWISQNFGFMYTLTGKIGFILYVAALCYNLLIFGKIVLALLVVLVVVNLGVALYFPKYSQWLRETHFHGLGASTK